MNDPFPDSDPTTCTELALEERAWATGEGTRHKRPFEVVEVFGLPVAKLTFEQTLDEIDRLIDIGKPGFFITANLHYAMLRAERPELDALSRRAHFIVADGAPLVRESRRLGNPLPERVTGADLIGRICRRAAKRGYRVFLLGGLPGIAEQAAAELCRRYPGLTIAGIAAPDFRVMDAEDHARLVSDIRATRPDILFAALGQPKGELWLDEHAEALGVPVTAQVGASFDFLAGRVKRAPAWIQRLGLEWLYRITREPARMIPRYWANGLFLLRWRLTTRATRAPS
jgi:N-acetylglucosaminyldiphosphoundecaprenol N-acetyl-beta-D-mannosaminyltransferase